jgi:hypothetical protein
MAALPGSFDEGDFFRREVMRRSVWTGLKALDVTA